MLHAIGADWSRDVEDYRRSLPDSRGVIRWLGVEWIGVPAPIRWACRHPDLRDVLGLPEPSGPFWGCGCIRRLKNATLRMKGKHHEQI